MHMFVNMRPPQLLHPDEDKRIQSVEQLDKLRFFEELSLEEVREKNVTPTFIPPVSQIIYIVHYYPTFNERS